MVWIVRPSALGARHRPSITRTRPGWSHSQSARRLWPEIDGRAVDRKCRADHLRTDKSALIGGWEVRLVPAHPQAGKTDEGACGSRSARSQVGRFCERVEKRFCRFEVGRIEPFGKPVVDRLEECRRIGGSTLIAK
jgi:hypothetical protein